jgi:hypothetical protein
MKPTEHWWKHVNYRGDYAKKKKEKKSVALVRERTIPTERPPLVSEVSANVFADRGCHEVRAMDPYGSILSFLDWRFMSRSISNYRIKIKKSTQFCFNEILKLQQINWEALLFSMPLHKLLMLHKTDLISFIIQNMSYI